MSPLTGRPSTRPSRSHPGRTSSPAITPLTRDEVLSTALAMIDADGVDALSMRRLGQAVHRDPMRLYRYAPSKSALLDAVTELVLADFVVPPVVDGNWEGALRSAANSFRGIAMAHPRVVPLLVTRPLSTPLGLRPPGTLRSLESLLEILLTAGFDETSALHAYRLFVGFLNGHILNEIQESVEDPEEAGALVRFGLHHLSNHEFPRMRQLASGLAIYDGGVELEAGLDVLLTGLRAVLAAVGTVGTEPPGQAPPVPPTRALQARPDAQSDTDEGETS